MTSRRHFLLGTATTIASSLTLGKLAFGQAGTDRRLVVVILRGGLDGLAAVPPMGDPHYASSRGTIVLDNAATDRTMLDGFFGLHAKLANLHTLYQQKELTIVHAVATPYRNRSHFDLQNVLENGGTRPYQYQDGWLNRALGAMKGPGHSGLAISQTVPTILRGPNDTSSWAPSSLPDPDDDTLMRLMDLYRNDPLLGGALSKAIETNQMAESVAGGKGGKRVANLKVAARTIAKFLTAPGGPTVAALEVNGWDTHANQGKGQGQLANKLNQLDQGVGELKKHLGPTWDKTVVVMATEFGRTVRANGTRGTDHGTGGAAFIVGGTVQGGRVLAEWPGLSPQDQQDGRDLKATIDLRSVFKGVLRDHLGISDHALRTKVFPESAAAKPMRNLVS